MTVIKEDVVLETEIHDQIDQLDWKVENVVGTINLFPGDPDTNIDLIQVARKVKNCEYNPDRFPGLILRMTEPIKVTILLFRTGKMVVTGLRNSTDIHTICRYILKKQKKFGMSIKGEPECLIHNFVVSANLHGFINLNEIIFCLDNALYEPEIFPGLIYRMREEKVVFLIFSSGKVVCTGAKNEEQAKHAIFKLKDIIAENNLFFENIL